jgi:5-methylcytosine-specific restriction endonuclease McrA
MEIISRKEAREKGLEWYCLGNKCPNGNVAPRKVKTADCWCADCRESVRARERARYYENRERILKRKADYHKENREKIIGYLNDYREENKSDLLRKKKEDYWSRRDVYRERNQRWIKNNPDKVRELNRNNRARRKGAEGTYTNADVDKLYRTQKGRCAACGDCLKAEGYHVDHIQPLILGGSNWPDNLQLLCPKCNLSKGGKDPYQWAMENGRLL